MRQELFTWGSVAVPSHECFVALAVLVGLGVFVAETRRRGAWDDRLIPVIAGVVVGGAIGARAAGMLDAFTEDGIGAVAWAWAHGGRSILGGLSGAYVGALVGKRSSGYPYRTGDLFAPAVAVALAVGRIGCFLSEAPGRPTQLPWGITVDPAVAPSIPECPGCLAGVPMHPSFLYEIAFLVAAFVSLLWLRGRIDRPGELLPMFLAGYAAFRFLVEFTRAGDVVAFGLTGSQLFIVALSPLLAVHVVTEARRGTYARVIRPSRAVRQPEVVVA
jgi:phosphatidylglycerol---prolipoprotein diacylglyceryl transferase